MDTQINRLALKLYSVFSGTQPNRESFLPDWSLWFVKAHSMRQAPEIKICARLHRNENELRKKAFIKRKKSENWLDWASESENVQPEVND